MLDIFDLDRRDLADQLRVAECDPSFEHLHGTRRRLFRRAYRTSLLDVLFPFAEFFPQFTCFDEKGAQSLQRLALSVVDLPPVAGRRHASGLDQVTGLGRLSASSS